MDGMVNSTTSSLPASGAQSTNEAAVAMAPPSSLYEDIVHIRAVRQALANGNAAVMVGSGFSKNAEGGQSVGTWDTLAKTLATGLSGGLKEVPFNAANATQLAEQYERLFSRPALEQVLKQVVPDERLAPGELHHSLLSLPWAEVLTTNYDTLLERAADRLVESSYVTICCREDIPLSRILGRRRIVKLHGSFSSHRPFILTEEDYRKYPDDFAPFVNLVRQSLLENVLSLIGFSGDDPNFLHWIGWVRDMLDNHALPIYLFVTKPPGLGQRMLLQARGVTPVLLPPSESGEESDYAGRYARLFTFLNAPLEGSAKEWGRVLWSDEHRQLQTSDDDRYAGFLRALPLIARHKAEYPGWLVAPSRVRRRFDASVRGTGSWFDDKLVVDRIKADLPAFAVACLSLYAWTQSTILQDLDDVIAAVSIEALKKTAGTQFSHLSKEERERLKELGVTTQSTLAAGWTSLGVEVLAWARQGHRWTLYVETKQLLKKWRKNDLFVADHIQHQDALRALHEGDRLEATRLLSEWTAGGSDAYMEIRRAALLAELGHVSEALSSCERAIQRLRQQQRLRPDDPLLLSQESWACLVAMQLHRGAEKVRRWGNAEESATEAKQRSDDFDERLKRLRSRGYAPDEELQLALEQLNQEAGSPTARNSRTRGFKGSVPKSTRFGTHEWHDKIQGAQAWLQLAERVGMIARAGRVRYHDEAFLEAAWWIRLVDPVERSIGLLVRSLRDEALRPYNERQPRHKTGWLSRLQVAQLPTVFALDLAERLLRNVEHVLSTPREVVENRSMLDFHLEIFGRLAVRIDSEQHLIGWGRRLLALHDSPGIDSLVGNWNGAQNALASCIEGLRPTQQRDLLLQAFRLPTRSSGQDSERSSNTINVYGLYREMDAGIWQSPETEAEWRVLANSLTKRLAVATSKEEKEEVWLRLFVVDELGLLNAQQRRRIGSHLWRDWNQVDWPSMEGFRPNAVLRWPAPPNIDSQAAYRESLLRRLFRPFSSGGAFRLELSQVGRSWSLPADLTLTKELIFAVDLPGWSINDFLRLLGLIEAWIDAEGEHLVSDAGKHEELKNSLQQLVELLDDLLGRMLLAAHKGHPSAEAEEVSDGVMKLGDRLAMFGHRSWRLDLLRAAKGSPELVIATRCQLEMALVSRDDGELAHGYRAASWLLANEGNALLPAMGSVFSRMVAVVSGRDMPALPWALEMLSTLPSRTWRTHLSLETLFVIDASLGQLRSELDLENQERPSAMSEDTVPLLRSKCAQLSYALLRQSGYECPNARAWLDAAESDPLPELRLGRYVHRVNQTELSR